MILATDEVFTYVIFNYVDMQWTSHTEAGGDTSGGEGGVPAYVSLSRNNILKALFDRSARDAGGIQRRQRDPEFRILSVLAAVDHQGPGGSWLGQQFPGPAHIPNRRKHHAGDV